MHQHVAAVVRASRVLLAKLAAVTSHPEYLAVWASYHARGGAYHGPQFTAEQAALKAALDRLDLHATGGPAAAAADGGPAEAYPIHVHAEGEDGVHTYRMSDGSYRALSEDDAAALMDQHGRSEIVGYRVSWQSGSRRRVKLVIDYDDADDYYRWRRSQPSAAPVRLEPLVVPPGVTL